MRKRESYIARDIVTEWNRKQRYIEKLERKKTSMERYKCTVIIPVYNQRELVLKAIDSIPKRKDIEIIVIDDGSDDGTWDNLIQYRNEHEDMWNLILLYNEENKGVAYTVNKGFDNAKGKYVVLLGSDDYFYTDKFEKCIEKLDGIYDMVYFDLERNDGSILHADKETTRNQIVGSVKFIKREFIGNIRCPVGKQFGEDADMHFKLLAKNPKELFTGIVAKHYNYPRINSLCWQEAERIKNGG